MEELESYNLLFFIGIHVTSILYNIFIKYYQVCHIIY